MARTKNPNTFASGHTSGIETAIRMLAVRQFVHIRQPWTFDDLRALYVPPEWRDKLSDVFAIAAPSGTTFSMDCGIPMPDEYVVLSDNPIAETSKSFSMHFSWRAGHDGGFLPMRTWDSTSKPVTVIQDDCPSELRENWLHMLREMCTVSHDFGEVLWLFQQLNKKEVCPTPAAMRYYWPAVLPLLDIAGCSDMSSKLRVPNARSACAAAIPSSIQQLLKPTYDFIARALLVEPIPNNQQRSMPISYHTNSVRFKGWRGVIDRF